MKKLSFLALAAVGLLLGACTDKDDTAKNAVNPEEFTDGAYIGISIQMPNTTATTRANEDFKDGDVAEWEVKDANLLIFRSDNEAEAVCVAVYELPKAVLDEPENNNVTATINKATRIDNDLANAISEAATDDDVHYYAYVIVNANGMVNPTDLIGTAFSDFCDEEFNVIGSEIAAECNIGAGGLLMTNAPVCIATTGGGGSAASDDPDDYTTLVEIDKTKIYSSAALAEKAGNQAACVYVERAAVKITVSKADDFVNNTGLGDVTFGGWQIVNYPNTYYNTRHIEPAWGALASDYTPALSSPYLYRFVSPTGFAPNVPSAHTGPFRTYFAKDLEYNTDATLQRTKADLTGDWITMGKSGYTTENTFDVAHQTWRNTTQVAVKVAFGTAGFWTVDGNPTKLSLAQAKTQLESNIKSNLTVQSKFQALLNKLAAGSYTLVITVTLTEPAAGKDNVSYTATAKVMSGESEIAYTGVTTEKTALDNAVTSACSTYKTSFYKNGEAYYYARIQHFGDVETPWSATNPWVVINPGVDVKEIYGVGATVDGNGNAVTVDRYNERFLGRYGVVRDNWYDIVIDEINDLGSAEPIDLNGEVGDTPDDVVNNYISVHVHIVPWVLRTQHVHF